MAKVVQIDPDSPAPELIAEAVRVLREKGVIIYPTETLYGLGANPFFPEAMERIYAIKGRAAAKPIPFLIKDHEMLGALVEAVPPLGRELMERYWPGPLTLIFRAKKGLAPPLRSKDGFIGLRISSHPIARRIVEAMDAPLTSTSANLAGGEDIIDGRQLAQLFGDQVDLIIDSGKVPGIGSTVVDLTVEPPRIVRQGMISVPLGEL
ncbi:MAG: L-threonylcarbamoyladenylate synthase [Deltaproteobacteria bacterium]|nr:L-threonylcarbamoyladenylate synthase [Deltaproteobacteria bacterium]